MTTEERRDIDVKAIAWFGLALVLAAAAIHVGAWALMRGFESREAAADRLPPALVRDRGARVPPEPRLRTAPRADLAELRAAEERVLETYGWVDRQRGIARIPIERAMDIVAKRGVPDVRAPAPPEAPPPSPPPETPPREAPPRKEMR